MVGRNQSLKQGQADGQPRENMQGWFPGQQG
jgi:hypothetical protein